MPVSKIAIFTPAPVYPCFHSALALSFIATLDCSNFLPRLRLGASSSSSFPESFPAPSCNNNLRVMRCSRCTSLATSRKTSRRLTSASSFARDRRARSNVDVPLGVVSTTTKSVGYVFTAAFRRGNTRHDARRCRRNTAPTARSCASMSSYERMRTINLSSSVERVDAVVVVAADDIDDDVGAAHDCDRASSTPSLLPALAHTAPAPTLKTTTKATPMMRDQMRARAW
mmetsp:Transcript_6734/g.22578  ORF Transcript_6734/g.22578 Transcript_6734/m.22578 type:complete len:228 (-) Transcript_6734:141-824(-)